MTTLRFKVEVPKKQTNNPDLAAAMPPGQFRIILNYKQQAASLTAGPGDDRMDLERNNYE